MVGIRIFRRWLAGTRDRSVAEITHAVLLGSVVVGYLFAAAQSSAALAAETGLHRFEFSEVHMGVQFNLLLYAPEKDSANRAATAAFQRVATLDRLLSDYNPDSELSRLSRTSGQGRFVPVSPELWTVLHRAQALAARTDGAFDITVGPYVRLWRRARRRKQLPSARRLAEARACVGYRYLQLDKARRAARLDEADMRLDLGGIAMGYAADEALAVVKKHGFSRAMVDASGDIVVGEPPPGAAGWKIGIAPLTAPDAPPNRFIWLRDAAVTASGDAFQFVEIDGRRYSHIVDPRTGLGLSEPSSVTVIAPDCITADSLATAVSVLGPDAGMELIEKTPCTAALFVRLLEGTVQTYQSKRLGHYEQP